MPAINACVVSLSAVATTAASRHGQPGNPSTLIAANAKVNQARTGGFTPLYIACQHGHGTLAKRLYAALLKKRQDKILRWAIGEAQAHLRREVSRRHCSRSHPQGLGLRPQEREPSLAR